MKMGFLGSVEWMNAYGKKRCKNLFWKVRAAVKKALKNGGKQHIKFQYDPSSYALNFDDGCVGDVTKKFFKDERFEEIPDVNNTTTWVYVLWVKTK